MNAQKVAARFIAFAYFLNQKQQPVHLEKAGRYARQHWPKFLPYANNKLAHFLTKTPTRPKRKSEKCVRTLVAQVSSRAALSPRQAWTVSTRYSMAHSH
jgi:hypothetical protein